MPQYNYLLSQRFPPQIEVHGTLGDSLKPSLEMAKRKLPLGRRSSKNRASSRAMKKTTPRAAAKSKSPNAAVSQKSPPRAAIWSFPRLYPQSLDDRASHTLVSAWLSSPGSSRTIMNLTHDAVIVRNPQDVIEAWNTAAEGLYGWSASEAIGRFSHELLDTRFPADLESINKTFASGFWQGELDHRRKDGRRITVLSRWSLLRTSSGYPLLIEEINRDLTQERRQLGYLRLLSDVGHALIEVQSVPEALQHALSSVCIHTRWCMGRAFAMNIQSSLQQPDVLFWRLSDEPRLAPVRQALEQRLQRIGEAPLAARALESNKPVWVENLALDPYFKNIPELAQAGLVSAFAQPIIASGTRAALLLLSDVPAEIDEPFLSAMSSVAAHLCRFFERLAAEDAQRRLSATLLRAQDDERRRIARELHDSAGQYLGALGLSLEAVRRVVPEKSAAVVEEKLCEAEDIIRRCSSDLRTLSHLLHPPLLEDLGLASAVNWYISGFADRSGIEVNAEISKLPRFDHSVELTLFRILQESLTNIHRHSGSKSASITISSDEHCVTLEIRDEGKGIPQETLRGWSRNTHRAGVGINGMRERVNDLGGSLDITSDKTGTTVRASIPLRLAASFPLADAAPAGVFFTQDGAGEKDSAPAHREKPENGSAQERLDSIGGSSGQTEARGRSQEANGSVDGVRKNSSWADSQLRSESADGFAQEQAPTAAAQKSRQPRPEKSANTSARTAGQNS